MTGVDRPGRRFAGLLAASLLALLPALSAACVGYTTGPGGTTIHRVGWPAVGVPTPAAPGRPSPAAR